MKSFWKTNRNNEEANEKSNVLIEKYDYISKNDSPDFMIQIEIFNKLADETNQDKIFKLSKEVNHVNLGFEYKEKKSGGKTFNDPTDAISLYENTKEVHIDLEKVRENQKEF